MVLLILWMDLQTSKCPSLGLHSEITYLTCLWKPGRWCIKVKLTEFNTRHSGGPEATWRASIPPTTAAQLLPHDVLRECQLHIAKFMIFPRQSGNSDICANVLSCKCWQLMSFSFLLNTMQPSSLDHHSVTSTLGILREDVRCATVCFYPSLLRNFTSLLSHTQGDVSRNTTLPLGRTWVWGKWKVGPLKTQIQPFPSCLWIEP